MKRMSKGIVTLTLVMAISLMLASGASSAQKTKVWVFPDVDGDFFGDTYNGVYTNKPEDYPDYISDGTDCDDGYATVFPGAPELCDGLPNNCDALDYPSLSIDEVDDDGDGFVECKIDGGGWFGAQIIGGGDCDDGWGECFPSAPACECTVVNPVASAGQIWMDRNLGASRVATSIDDAAAYGDLYQWGRGADGHQLRTSATTYTLSSSDDPGHGDFIANQSSPPYDWRSPQNDNLWQGVSGINNPCPAGFRLPTAIELDTERVSWSSNDSAGAFASPLKLVPAGYRRDSNDTLTNVGSLGYYRSSSVNGSDSSYLWINFGNSFMYDTFRSAGFSVRCLMD